MVYLVVNIMQMSEGVTYIYYNDGSPGVCTITFIFHNFHQKLKTQLNLIYLLITGKPPR